jgi:hypothetical protein
MIEEDTPRSFASPRDDRFFTPRTIARSNSTNSNSDGSPREFGTPRDFQTPRSYPDSDRKERPLQHYASLNSGSKEYYNVNDYYGQSKPTYPADAKGSYNNNNTSNGYNNNNFAQSKSSVAHPPLPSDRRRTQPPPQQQQQQQYQSQQQYNNPDQHYPQDDDVEIMQNFGEYELEEIFSFARHGRCEEIEKLLDQGLPVDVRDEWGNTLLIIACQNGNKRAAKTVLRRGANINSRNFKGNTPLHYCYQCKT